MLTLPDYIVAVQVGMKLFGSCVWLQQMGVMFVFSIFPQEGDLFGQGIFTLAGTEFALVLHNVNTNEILAPYYC